MAATWDDPVVTWDDMAWTWDSGGMSRFYVAGIAQDNLGNALKGVKVYLFPFGTGATHPEPTHPTGGTVTGSFYATDSGGTPLANPLTTNERGKWEAYFDTQQRLDVVYSSNNNLAVIAKTGKPYPFAQYVDTDDMTPAVDTGGGGGGGGTTITIKNDAGTSLGAVDTIQVVGAKIDVSSSTAILNAIGQATDYVLVQETNGNWAAKRKDLDAHLFENADAAVVITAVQEAARLTGAGASLAFAGAPPCHSAIRIDADGFHIWGPGISKESDPTPGQLLLTGVADPYSGGLGDTPFFSVYGASCGVHGVLVNANNLAKKAFWIVPQPTVHPQSDGTSGSDQNSGNRFVWEGSAAFNGAEISLAWEGSDGIFTGGQVRMDVGGSGGTHGISALTSSGGNLNMGGGIHVHGSGAGIGGRVAIFTSHMCKVNGVHFESGNSSTCDWAVEYATAKINFTGCVFGSMNVGGHLYGSGSGDASVSGCTFAPEGLSATDTYNMLRVDTNSRLELTGSQAFISLTSGENNWHYALTKAANAKVIMVGNRLRGAQAIPWDNQPTTQIANTWNDVALTGNAPVSVPGGGGGGGIVIPGADPTGIADSTSAITAWASAIPAGSYIQLSPAKYKVNGTTPAALNLADGVTIEAYGVKFFEDVHTATINNSNLVNLNGNNIEVKGLEIYGYNYANVTVDEVILGSAAAGTYVNAVSGSATPDASTYSTIPQWYARDVNGNMHEDWPLISFNGALPSVFGSDVAVVASECVWDILPPQTALTVTDNTIVGSGPTASTHYAYACSRLLSDLRETGLGPITHYLAGGTKHGVTVSGFPPLPAGNAISSGVMAHGVYRTKTPGVIGTWKLVAYVPVSMTSYTDQFDDADLTSRTSAVGTSVVLPGQVPVSPGATYTITRQITDDEARILTWCQRISPTNGNTITVGTVHEVGRVTQGPGSSGAVALGQNGVKILSQARNVTLTDWVVEGVNYVNISVTSANFPTPVTLNNCRARGSMQNVLGFSSGYLITDRGGRYGESVHTVWGNEPETTGAATSDLTLIGTIIAGGGTDAHLLNTNPHCIRTRFEGAIFRTFFDIHPLDMSEQSLTGWCQVIDTGYLDSSTTAEIAQFEGRDIDLEMVAYRRSLLTVSEIGNPGSLAGGESIGNDAMGVCTITSTGPNVATMKVGNANAPIFGVGDYGFIYNNHIRNTDPPFTHTISSVAWAGGVATLTLAIASAPGGLLAGIDNAVTTMTVANTQATQNLFPDLNWRPSGIWHYACLDAGTANEEWVAVTGKTGTHHGTWTITRNALPSAAGGNIAHAHLAAAPVQMSTSQQVGDSVVVSGITPTGYNGVYAIASITPTGLTYTLSDPGAGTSTGTTVGAQAWNGTGWIVASISGTGILPGDVLTLNGYLGGATKSLPSPASGAALQNIPFVPQQKNVKIKLRTPGVAAPQNGLTLTCPNSRVDMELNDGTNLTFVSDSGSPATAYQTGHIGNTTTVSGTNTITGFTKTGTGPYTVTFTTSAAHTIVAGSAVNVSSVVSSGTAPNGAFTVVSSANNTHFVVSVAADPGTYTSGGTVLNTGIVAGPFPFAAGCRAADPVASKLLECTVAGTTSAKAGTWKLVAVT